MSLKVKRKISAIILSAGFSSRMESFKPLLKLGTRTALEHIVYSFYKGDVEDIVVVIGHKAQEIKNTYKGPEIKFVYNRDYSKGMYSSVVEGVKNLDKENEGFFVIPVDTPIIKHLTIGKIKRAFQESGKGIIYPNFNGTRGHPPLISSIYINKIINYNGEGGLRNLLDSYKGDSYDLKVVDQGVVLDMDTPQDYKALLDYYKNHDIPNREECRAILDKYCVSGSIIRHSEKVKEVAFDIANRLVDKDLDLNLRLIEASALLHDVEKGKPKHAERGGKLLDELGYPKVAEIIKEHMDINVKDGGLSEKEIVYISDKMVVEDRIVSIEDRFKRSLSEFKANKEAIQMIEKKIADVKKIKQKIDEFGEYNYGGKWKKTN